MNYLIENLDFNRPVELNQMKNSIYGVPISEKEAQIRLLQVD